jgi:hypothetical protein
MHKSTALAVACAPPPPFDFPSSFFFLAPRPKSRDAQTTLTSPTNQIVFPSPISTPIRPGRPALGWCLRIFDKYHVAPVGQILLTCTRSHRKAHPKLLLPSPHPPSAADAPPWTPNAESLAIRSNISKKADRVATIIFSSSVAAIYRQSFAQSPGTRVAEFGSFAQPPTQRAVRSLTGECW